MGEKTLHEGIWEMAGSKLYQCYNGLLGLGCKFLTKKLNYDSLVASEAALVLILGYYCSKEPLRNFSTGYFKEI